METADSNTARRQIRPSSSTRFKSDVYDRVRYVDLNGNLLGTITAGDGEAMESFPRQADCRCSSWSTRECQREETRKRSVDVIEEPKSTEDNLVKHPRIEPVINNIKGDDAIKSTFANGLQIGENNEEIRTGYLPFNRGLSARSTIPLGPESVTAVDSPSPAVLNGTTSAATKPIHLAPQSFSSAGSTPTPMAPPRFDARTVESTSSARASPVASTGMVGSGFTPVNRVLAESHKRASLPSMQTRAANAPAPETAVEDYKIHDSSFQASAKSERTPLSQYATHMASPAPSKPPSATLCLIVEKVEGALDSGNPISENDLRNADLGEFFILVSRRRQDPTAFISRLTLTQRWGGKASFAVDKNTSDAEWRKIRSDIRRNFAWMAEKKPDKKRFEVYISSEGDDDSSVDEDYE